MTELNYANDKPSRYLYFAGGCTAVLFILYSIATIIIFATVGEGYPETATECFNMIAENKFIALLRLDIVSVIVIPFYYLLFFSLYHALKKDHELFAKAAMLLTAAGITVFISGLNITSILILSDKYHAAADPHIKQQLLAACESMLANDMWINTGGKIRGIMIETGSLFFSIIMLKTNVFNKFTAITGIIAHGFDLSSEILSIFFPFIKDFFTMIAGPLYIIWFILLAVRFFQISTYKKL
jgi:hypothetical protein